MSDWLQAALVTGVASGLISWGGVRYSIRDLRERIARIETALIDKALSQNPKREVK